MTKDEEYLKILAVFHFVVAGLATLFALFPIIHLVLGIAMLSGAFESPSDEPPLRLIGWAFTLFAASFIIMGLAFAACVALAGKYLLQRRHYMFCLVMAGVACMFMPFGTVLGVFTIIVLIRQEVRQLFGYDMT